MSIVYRTNSNADNKTGHVQDSKKSGGLPYIYRKAVLTNK